jgi:peptide deformylase
MAMLEVLKFPDPRLREVSQAVTHFDAKTKARLSQLAQDMFETMYAENGIGLAAPQVGELVRMLVIDARPRDTGGRYTIEQMTELERSATQPLVIINPVIKEFSGKTTFDEGCLSVPSFFDTVERNKYIELEYHDLEGKKQLLKTDGLLAIVCQHEMDHLEGTLFIDHLSLVKSNKIKNQIKKHGYPAKRPKGQEGDSEDDEDVEL